MNRSRIDRYLQGETPRGPSSSLLARRLERTLTRLLRELEDEEGPGAESLRRYLRGVVENALGERTQTEASGSTAPTSEPGLDPESARAAVDALHRLELAALHAALVSVSASVDEAMEVEGIFKTLSAAENELLGRALRPGAREPAELLAEVFHDLKSPLTTIMFLADALHSGQSGDLSDTQTEQIRIIYNASLTLLTLAENVLSSRNIAKGELKPEFLPFSVGATLDEVERITRPLADQYGLEIEFRRDCASGRVGDADALRRILLNLVTNALSYTETGGVSVRVLDQGSDLLLEVEDTGPGMSEEKLAELFTPYDGPAEGERGGGRTGPRRFSQAGLGLSICHRLATLVGGEIEAESELGRGTSFTVRLPFPIHQ